MHPGHWGAFIGRQLMLDETIAVVWGEVFGASLLSGGKATEDVDVLVERLRDSQKMADVVTKNVGETRRTSTSGWTRAVLPIAAPIGVVR